MIQHRAHASTRRAASAEPLSCRRGCGSHDLSLVLDLGQMPLVNALSADQGVAIAAPRFPLALVFCGGCSLVQLSHDVAPEALFSDYTYFSSYSETMLRHVERLTEELTAKRALDKNSLVVEIASNDGYLLQYYRAKGVPVLGIEPAHNVARVAIEQRQIPTIVEFFGVELAMRLGCHGVLADVVHAHNTLAHTPHLAGFIHGLGKILRPEGVVCIEVPHVVSLVESSAFDTIYHEHYSYFSLTTIERLFAAEGLTVTRVEKHAIHGGSLRVYARLSARGVRADASVAKLRAEEAAWGVDNPDTYRALAERAVAMRDGLRKLVKNARRRGKPIAAYGASAKGCVTLNFAQLGADDVAFVVDKSPHKQGRFVPGSGVPILAPEELVASMPELTLLTTWNLREEILAQQSEYRRRGGRFVVPVPHVEVLP